MTRPMPLAPHRTAAAAGLVGTLFLLNGALLATALRAEHAEISDGAHLVTQGATVAAGIGATLLLATIILLTPLPAGLRALAACFALAAQAAHALGHLAGLYYALRWYDDALHATLILLAALLCLRVAWATRLLPREASTPARSALLVLFAAVAMAGAWEMFEFTMDVALGTREQDDLSDTMLDMVDGTIGGALGALWIAARLSSHPWRSGEGLTRRAANSIVRRKLAPRAPGGNAPPGAIAGAQASTSQLRPRP